jgi:hypothetical protein
MHHPTVWNPLPFIVQSVAARIISGGLVLLLALLPLRVAATTVVPPTFDKLVNTSDYVVRAVVKSVTSEYRVKNGKRKIYTSVELDVREVIAGTPPAHLVLEMLGGIVGPEEMRIDGTPVFHVGDEDILFIRDNGKVFCPLTAVMHGRYPVLKDRATRREYVARSNKVPLTNTDEVALPMAEGAAAAVLRQAKTPDQALAPAEFTQRIRSAATSSTTPSRLH